MTKQNMKLLVGPRIRRLRLSMGLTQAAMAGQLSISTSYLNLIERNQRPVSAKVLLRMAETYDLDISELSPQKDVQLIQELREVLKSRAYSELAISRDEIEDSVNASPNLVQSFLDLHTRMQDLTVRSSLRNDPLADREKVELLEESAGAIDIVRKFIHEHSNYFDPIDRAAEALSDELKLDMNRPQTALTERLKAQHGIRVRIVPADILPGRLSQFDPHASRLDLSELLPQSGRRFQIAYRLGLLEQSELISSMVLKAIFDSKEADALCRVTLANYFAAAVLMPYERFLKAAESQQYDVELLSRRFDTSYEQTAHRLTTLQRRGRSGIPFFFVRVDMAGNVSKRFSSGRFHFSRFGGACPLWNIHGCFQTPGECIPQIIEMPDETKYFSIARAVLRPEAQYGQGAQMVAIAIGCDLKYAENLIYAQNMLGSEPTPIGVNCYLCERENCRSRAHAPINRTLSFDERARGMSIFKF
jgi:predicted transcriptional regulator/transcriptional regulator with XRE-family HTH domain